jgi:hypothetical protein
LAAEEDKQDTLQELFGKRDSSRSMGQCTREFFGLDTEKPHPSVRSSKDAPDLPVAVRPNAESSPEPGPFTSIFGRGDADMQPRECPARDQSPSGVQSKSHLPEAGALADLFGAPCEVPSSPLNAQAGTFTDLFQREVQNPQIDQRPESGRFSSPAGSVSSLELNDSIGDCPGISPNAGYPPREKMDLGCMTHTDTNQAHDPARATRLFPVADPPGEHAADSLGPSAFTQIIASSTLRTIEEKSDRGAATVGSDPQPPPAASVPNIPVPQIASQCPVGNMPPPPVHPYLPQQMLPQQPLAMQIPMPLVSPVAWRPTPQLLSVQAQPPPQMQSEQQTPQQKWITYLPVIVGLNLLFLLAVVFILAFALAR